MVPRGHLPWLIPSWSYRSLAEYRLSRLLRISSSSSSDITSNSRTALATRALHRNSRWPRSGGCCPPVGCLALLRPVVRPPRSVNPPCATPRSFRSANGKNTSSALDGQRPGLGSAGLDRVEARTEACQERRWMQRTLQTSDGDSMPAPGM